MAFWWTLGDLNFSTDMKIDHDEYWWKHEFMRSLKIFTTQESNVFSLDALKSPVCSISPAAAPPTKIDAKFGSQCYTHLWDDLRGGW